MIVQQLLNGITTGSVYTLFALGFTIVFGTQRILNLSHGAIFMAGAFIGYYATRIGLSFLPAVLLAMVGSALIACLTDLVAFRRLRASGQIEFGALISSIGVGLILTSLGQLISKTKVLVYPFDLVPNEFFQLLGVRVSLLQIVTITSVVVTLALVFFVIYRTSLGRQIRATAGNERAAVLLGVNPTRVYLFVFAISGALAGYAGVLIGLLFNSVHFMMGDPYLLKAFVIVVLGGLGSLYGAVVAGFLLGIVQAFAIAYFTGSLADIIFYSLVFLILVVRPGGLFGNTNSAVKVGRV
ncbi:amino acid/amide ABC transporter membrane protein 1 (HAAT family) [Advenella incenata]|uniref:Amino acid/amide ABC transporter membrane protein 1 (HAAT family) n=1 Tax=Advenella incenata TaxID=267800 RepID=A0A4Q7VFU6_9BURK|nr:branched-chain amino acid ABC transporter permease [Advenella incenata]RZT94868.1 amino acid/amide ABC transporter membrane protein 1 (HAAT family) [Advenella incenata]